MEKQHHIVFWRERSITKLEQQMSTLLIIDVKAVYKALLYHAIGHPQERTQHFKLVRDNHYCTQGELLLQ